MLTSVSWLYLAPESLRPAYEQMVLNRPGRQVFKTGIESYDATHVVETADLDAARLLLTPEVCDFADDQHWSEWRVDGDWLCHTRVSLDDPTPTPTVLATLRNLIAFAELIASKANDDGCGLC